MENLKIGKYTLEENTVTDIFLKVSETYTHTDITMPVRVIRGKKPGPTVFITAGIHGDEINGVGILHDLMYQETLQIKSGTLILLPIVNVFGFEMNTRYLPDRRDLNRSFPGNKDGSLAARHAYLLMKEIVSKCDYGIDLHTAGFQRTNYPNVRADTSDPRVKKLAKDFGTTVILDGAGPDGSLRQEACKIGCPTIILEVGETFKIEPAMLKIGVRGIKNVLITLKMIEGTVDKPKKQLIIKNTTWVRSALGGIVRFKVIPGDLVKQGQHIGSNFTIFGQAQNELISPCDGIVLGLTTLPAVKPGEPICHIGRAGKDIKDLLKTGKNLSDELHDQARLDLATSISLIDRD